MVLLDSIVEVACSQNLAPIECSEWGPDITGTISNAKASPQVAVVPGYGQKEDSGLSTTIGTLSLTSDTARVEAARLHVC